jgi:hypothetical protein
MLREGGKDGCVSVGDHLPGSCVKRLAADFHAAAGCYNSLLVSDPGLLVGFEVDQP